ncbi:MAG: hypothetical protein AAGC55_02360 [Myxococcota bacterium]
MSFTNTFRPTTQIHIGERADTGALASLETAMVIIGAKIESGTATLGELVQVFSAAQADVLFGLGSELANQLRWVYRGLQDAQTGGVRLYALPLAEPTGAIARVVAVNFGNTAAAEAGVVKLRIAGERISANVAAGDSPFLVSQALTEAVNARRRELLFTAEFSPQSCTLTAINKGSNANQIAVEVVSAPPGMSVEVEQTTAGVGEASIETALFALEAEDIQVVSISGHSIAAVTAAKAHVNKTWTALSKRWRWVFLGSRSLPESNQLSTIAEHRGIVVVCAKDAPNTPAQLAAYMAARVAAEPQPNRPFDAPMPLDSLYLAPKPLLDSEIETLGPRGIWLLDINGRRSGMISVRGVTTQTLVDGVRDDSQLDIGVSRSQVEFSRQLDAAIARNFSRVLKTDENKARVRDVCISVALGLETRNILRDVLALRDLFRVEDTSDDPSIPVDTVRIRVPASVIPALRHKHVDISLIVR